MRKAVCKTRNAEAELIGLIRKAHAGERAAALAYQGHARILRSSDERRAVEKIEADEWRHRSELGAILGSFHARPAAIRELTMLVIGRVISIGCFVCGRFVATYFAAILETSNVAEYEIAAELAAILSRTDLESKFREMARTEAEHERVLYNMIENDPRLRVFAAVTGRPSRATPPVR